MADKQLEHSSYETAMASKKIILMCDGIQSPANIGALFRLGDAFGVEEIIFGNAHIDLSSGRLRKTARHTFEAVRFRESEHLPSTLLRLHDEGFTSIALEITTQSAPLSLLKKNSDKMILIIGNERHGISDEVLALCHKTVHIPMYGHNSSMNVAQAAAIAFYELRRD